MLPHFADLTTINRGAPCVEYPGTWIAYVMGEEAATCADREEAVRVARQEWEASLLEDCTTSVSWRCSDNDPRVGQVWFTGYYQLGRFDRFGRWVS